MSTQFMEPTLAERRQLARTLAEQPDSERIELARQLAADPRMEVRKDLIGSLDSLPEAECDRLTRQLAGDSSLFVRRAVERRLKRLKQAEASENRRNRRVSQFAEDLDVLQQRFGPQAAGRVRQLAEQWYHLLAGYVGHELDNVLAAIKGHSYMLLAKAEEGEVDEQRLLRALRTIHQQCEFGEQMVVDMRDYTRPVPRERRHEEVQIMVDEALKQVQDVFDAKKIDTRAVKIETRIPGGLAAEVSRFHFKMALVHLVNNACEAFLNRTTQNLGRGRVTLRANVLAGDLIEVTVADNGPGIDPELLSLLREFVPGRTTKNGYGTGFGLPTVEHYVTAHGGTLCIDSQPGRGTEVQLVIPRSTESAPQPSGGERC